MDNQIIKTQIHIDLSDEQYLEVETLAGCNYTAPQMAMYFNVSKTLFQKELDNPDSKLKHHYERGLLYGRYLIEKKNKKNAEEGNTTSVQIYNKMAKENRLNKLKHEFFGL